MSKQHYTPEFKCEVLAMTAALSRRAEEDSNTTVVQVADLTLDINSLPKITRDSWQ